MSETQFWFRVENADAWECSVCGHRLSTFEYQSLQSHGCPGRLLGPSRVTDDQLRAECERRGLIGTAAVVAAQLPSSVIVAEYERRLGAAPLLRPQTGVEPMPAPVPEPTLRGLQAWLPDKPLEFGTDRREPRTYERGRGIVATKPQSEPLAFLDEDLLADDA